MIAIITAAGISSRFNFQQSNKILKAVYYEGDRKNTLLYRLCQQCRQCDKIIAVGGYQFDRLQSYIDEVLPAELRKKIVVIFNPHYEDYSSGYSLYLGLNAAFRYEASPIVFLEGDLVVDDESLSEVFDADGDVLTFNRETIDSQKSVVFYEDARGDFRYAFNSSHGFLSINEPFRRIWNSGQVWKFADVAQLEYACGEFFDECVVGTNLEIVQRYFDHTTIFNHEHRGGGRKRNLIAFRHWFNCNTRADYAHAFNIISTKE